MVPLLCPVLDFNWLKMRKPARMWSPGGSGPELKGVYHHPARSRILAYFFLTNLHTLTAHKCIEDRHLAR